MAFSPEQALALLTRAQRQHRLAHAYLITGQPGSGKRRLAQEFAGLLHGVPAEKALDHEDVHVAEPESKSRRIVIEQIRSLESGLQMRSGRGGQKLGIIFDADRLQPQASNAFLKTLEEPPAQSLLVLVTAQPELLLDTIISRCILLPLAPAPRKERSEPERHLLTALQHYARNQDAGLASVYGLVRAFTVQLQALREAISSEHAAEFKKEEQHYKQTSEAGKWLDEREDHFKALTEARYLQARFTLVDVMMQWWTDALRQQVGVIELDVAECAADTALLAEKLAPPDILRRLRGMEELRENLNRNIQEALAIEVAFLKTFGS